MRDRETLLRQILLSMIFGKLRLHSAWEAYISTFSFIFEYLTATPLAVSDTYVSPNWCSLQTMW